MVGESVASAFYGEPRATLDVDFAVPLGEEHVDALCDALGVVKTIAEDLDHTYLERWAPELGIEDLLARLLLEAGLGG